MNRSVWDGDWMPATKETLMPPEPEQDWREAGCSRMCSRGHTRRWGSCAYGVESPPQLHRFRTGTAPDGCVSGWHEAMGAEQVAEWLRAQGYDVTPRASQAAIGLDQLAKLAEQAIADHSVCVNEGCPDERIIPPSLRWFIEDYLPAALADGAAPRASQAAEPSTAPCWLCQNLGGIAIHEKWTAERGKPLWTAHTPGSAKHPVHPCPACAGPRAPQAATATHSTGDGAGAAHDPHKPAAGVHGPQEPSGGHGAGGAAAEGGEEASGAPG